MERNDLMHDDVVSVIFTTSRDLTSAFPATAARGVGFGDIPLLCASEIRVPGSATSICATPSHSVMTSPNSRHAHVVGLGLIGASIALALRQTGWTVTGTDLDGDAVRTDR